MRLATIRLLFVTALFVGWLGYLGYLVATRPTTPGGQRLVLSRPQILTSQIDIIAEIDDTEKEVTVHRVLWPEDAELEEGTKIKIDHLGKCRANRAAPLDFIGADRYLVPLRQSLSHKGTYEVAPIPASPGYPGEDVYRIYPATDEARAQYLSITKPR